VKRFLHGEIDENSPFLFGARAWFVKGFSWDLEAFDRVDKGAPVSFPQKQGCSRNKNPGVGKA
jgi:hypothetical protein